MKVYVVTAGCYSDKHIIAVFSDGNKAQVYADLDDGREVLEFELDAIQLEHIRGIRYLVGYDIVADEILYSYINDGSEKEDVVYNGYYCAYRFVVWVRKELLDDIMKHGRNNSPMLKKIAQDRFAEYLYDNNISREELLEQKKEKYDKLHRPVMYMSSNENPIEKIAGKEVTEKINMLYDNGEELPDAWEVLRMIQESMKKNMAD